MEEHPAHEAGQEFTLEDEEVLVTSVRCLEDDVGG